MSQVTVLTEYTNETGWTATDDKQINYNIIKNQLTTLSNNNFELYRVSTTNVNKIKYYRI